MEKGLDSPPLESRAVLFALLFICMWIAEVARHEYIRDEHSKQVKAGVTVPAPD